MRSLGGLSVLGPLLALIAGCGGGGTSEGARFCSDWATAFCQRLYDCTPAEMRGADFLGGSSQSECKTIWSHACSDKPPDGVTFDVNCSGGAHVNKVARDMCFSELSTVTCDDFNEPTHFSICSQVCPGGTGAGGMGGAGGSGSAGDATSFCYSLFRKECWWWFTCVPAELHTPDSQAMLGSTLAECQGTKATAACTNVTCNPAYDVAAGTQCLSTITPFTCTDFANSGIPASCDSACSSSGSGIGGFTGTGGTGGAGGGGTGGGGAGGTTLGPNVVTNPSFTDGQTGWGVTTNSGTLMTYQALSGEFCLYLGPTTSVTLRWPTDVSAAASITSGTSYRFAYAAETSQALASVEARVGQAVAPYTADFSATETLVVNQYQQLGHSFTAAAADPQAGVSFTIVSGTRPTTTVCVDEVALQAYQ